MRRKIRLEPWQRTLYIVFFAQLITGVGFSAIFPFLPFYVEDLGTNTDLSVEFLSGLVFSAQAFTMMIASPIWGAIADRFGRKLMIERAAFGGAVLLLLMGFARTSEDLVALRAIQGLVTGVMAAANALVAGEVPRKHIGYAMGLLQVGIGTGIALGPMIGGAIADSYGYAAAFYIPAGLLLLVGLMVLFGVQENFVPIERPVGKGWGFVQEWKDVLGTPGVTATYSVSFLTQLGRMLIVPILPLFIQTLMLDPSRLNTFTGLVVGVGSAATTLSAVFLGRLGDRVGHRNVLLASNLAAIGVYLLQSRATEGWHLLVMQALVGVAMGGIIPITGALLATFTKMGDEGAVYGLDNSIRAGSRSIAPLLGSSIALWFDLRATFVATAVIFVLMQVVAMTRLPRLREVASMGED
jgi:DHA1 family multidrug resistance protein-like MFS transporter